MTPAITQFTLIVVFISGFVLEAKVILSPEADPSTRLNFEGQPESVDYDDNYSITVTQGHEVISSTLTRNGHYPAISVRISAFNEVFILDLKLNTYLFKVGYVEKFFSRSGVAKYNQVNHTEDHCYYLGSVRNRTQSTAAISTCKGISGSFSVGITSYQLEAIGGQVQGPHKVYRSQGHGQTKFKCGTQTFDHESPFNREKLRTRLKKRSPLSIWPQDLDKTVKVVELFVVNDNSQYQSHGNNVYERTKAIVNVASSAYQSLGIYLVLVGIEVWTSGNRINIDLSNTNTTIDHFSTYRMNSINPIFPNDNAVLLMNKTFSNGVVGIGNYAKMCSFHLSASIVADLDPSPSLAGDIMAHEMGHNFGLPHDEDVIPCHCSDPNSKCIMNAVADKNGAISLTWSQCSVDHFPTAYQYGLDYCLYNVPQTVYGNTSTCGNGIVEPGEQCDCGHAPNQQCNKGCCDSRTCQLIAPAACAFGRCCNLATCQVLSCGTLCRSKADNCDLEEFCDGQSSLCPQDTYKQDGTSCTTPYLDLAYCYSGSCKSRTSQCQLLGAAQPSSDNCYNYFNPQGIAGGNCGVNWFPSLTYINCSISDALCGRLLCHQNTTELKIAIFYSFATNGITISTVTEQCNSVIFDYGLEIQDPGLIPNGAPCGTGMMCLKQKCVNVSSIATTSCASQCQSNEICNNLGQCQSTNSTTCSTATTPATTTKTTTLNTASTTSGSTMTTTTTTTTTVKPSGSQPTGSTTTFPSSVFQEAAKTAIIGIAIGSALAAVICFSCVACVAARCFGFS